MKKALLTACTSGEYFDYSYAMLESFFVHNDYDVRLLGINLTDKEVEYIERDFPRVSIDSQTLDCADRNSVWFHRLLWFGEQIMELDIAACLDADALFFNPVDPAVDFNGDIAMHFRNIKGRPDLDVMIGFMMFRNTPAVAKFFRKLKEISEETDWESFDIIDQYCVSQAIKATPELDIMRLGPIHYYCIDYNERRAAIYQPRGGVRTRADYQNHLKESLKRRDQKS